jgi:hypothetical protein
MFSDDKTFHISDKVNCHSCHTWGREKPQEVRNMKKTAFKKSCIISPFLFNKVTVSGECYHAILKNFLIPELGQVILLNRNLFQQDRMYDSYWMMSSHTTGSVELDQFLGHLIHMIWPHWATFYGVMLKQLCTRQNHVLHEGSNMVDVHGTLWCLPYVHSKIIFFGWT